MPVHSDFRIHSSEDSAAKTNEQEGTEKTEERVFLCCLRFLLFKMRAGKQDITQS